MEKKIKITVINDTEFVGPNQFPKRTIEAETIENNPSTYLFEFHHDNVSIPDPFKVGDELMVSFDMKGKKWKKPEHAKYSYFVTLVAWNLKRI